MEKIEWSAPEYIHTNKTVDWYWIVSIISISIAVIAIILNNIIFAVLILVSGFTLSLFASRKPNTVFVRIDNIDVSVGSMFYSYKNLESFHVEIGDKFPRIILKSKSYLSPIIKVLIHPDDASDIENFLSEHLKKRRFVRIYI